LLTGKIDQVDKVVGLEVGADDYVTKPFDSRELLARVNSTLRRVMGTRKTADEGEAPVLTFSGWRIDLGAHELLSPAGESVHLTGQEFQLLATFAKRPNRALTRDYIMDAIGGRDWNPIDRSIDVLIAKLRRKIEQNPKQPDFIKSVRGVGYKFKADVKELSP